MCGGVGGLIGQLSLNQHPIDPATGQPYDELRGYSNINLALIFTNQDGWQAMAYVKNVFDTTALTGTFLNSDDTALTTNVFTTDPRLFGIRITKNW
jgi:outer membrane receptor protein involved in Fe transport